jgi:lipopolysaccharide export system permease protein
MLQVRLLLFSIIDRMLMREVFRTLLVIVSVLLLLILANSLVQLLGQVAAGSISMKVMGVLVGLKVIKLLGFILPPAFFFSILWGLGRMYRDSEMVALNCAGAGLSRLYRVFFLTAIPLAALVAVLVLVVLPQARVYADHLQQQEKKQFRIGGLKPGAFNEFSKGRFMIYVGHADEQGDGLRDVFVRYVLNGEPGILVAERARLAAPDETGGKYLLLEEGQRYQGVPGKTPFSIADFKRYALLLPDAAAEATKVSRTALPTSVLMASDDIRFKAELQDRLSAPLSIFALMLLSVPLARSLPRQGVYGRLMLAVIIYAIYMNLLGLAGKWMAKGVTPEWMGIWWVPGLAVLLAILITRLDSLSYSSLWRNMKRRLA